VLGNGDDVEGQSTAVHDVSGGGAMAWCRCVPCCWPTSAEQLAAEGSSEDPRHGGVSPAAAEGGACLLEGGAYPVSRKGVPTLSLGGGRLPCLSEGGRLPWVARRARRGGADRVPGWGGESAGVARRERRADTARARGEAARVPGERHGRSPEEKAQRRAAK
jgi:hypothetical protein